MIDPSTWALKDRGRNWETRFRRTTVCCRIDENPLELWYIVAKSLVLNILCYSVPFFPPTPCLSGYLTSLLALLNSRFNSQIFYSCSGCIHKYHERREVTRNACLEGVGCRQLRKPSFTWMWCSINFPKTWDRIRDNAQVSVCFLVQNKPLCCHFYCLPSALIANLNKVKIPIRVASLLLLICSSKNSIRSAGLEWAVGLRNTGVIRTHFHLR